MNVSEAAKRIAERLIPYDESQTRIVCFLHVPKDVPRESFRNWRRNEVYKEIESVLRACEKEEGE